MSKVFAILFSALILVQSFNISFEDFSKFNVLLEHAQFHQEKYGDSFFEFLVEHYGEDMLQHENNHQEHEELPFKHQQDCTHITFDFTASQMFDFDNNQPSFIQIPFNFFYKESSSLFEKSSVFQPPKLV